MRFIEKMSSLAAKSAEVAATITKPAFAGCRQSTQVDFVLAASTIAAVFAAAAAAAA